MKLGYFPGCSLMGSSREFDESLRAIVPHLGIELEEVPDWNCCGATAAHNLNHTLAVTLVARILAKAEQAGMEKVLAPCAACYSRLISTYGELLGDKELKDAVVKELNMDFQGTAEVLNILEVLQTIFSNSDGPEVSQPFARKVACYYGCLLVRPPKVVNFDRPEDPVSMDEIMTAIGAEPIDWAYKVECCGAGFTISRPELVIELCSKIVEDAVRRGAEAIIVSCPMCHTNLDLRRPEINKHTGKKHTIPVLYVTQAVGLALGVPGKTLGLHRHNVPVVFSNVATTAVTGTREV